MKISASEGFVCPNCRTLNNPNAEICVACGIHFKVYDEVKQELSQRINEKQGQFLKTIQQKAQQKLIIDQKVLYKDFVKQLIIILLIGIACIPIIWGSLKIIQHQKIEQQQFLETNYQDGVTCLAVMDYQCANVYFQKVYAKDKSFRDNQKLLLASKFGISEEYFASGQISKSIDILNAIVFIDTQNIQALKLLDNYHKILGASYKDQRNWQKAIYEYSSALKAMPDDFAARNEINEVYTLWIKEESAKGDIFSVWKLNRQQDDFNDK